MELTGHAGQGSLSRGHLQVWTCSEVQQELQALQKHKDKTAFPSLSLLGQKGRQSSAHILPSLILSCSSKHSSGECRGVRGPAGGTRDPHLARFICPFPTGVEGQRQSNVALAILGTGHLHATQDPG